MLQIWLIPAFPLIGAILNGFFGKRFGKRFVSFVGPLAIAFAFLQSVILFFASQATEEKVIQEALYTWIQIGSFELSLSFQIDQLSGYFLLFITGIGFLIHIYSIGYMYEEKGFYRFFSYLNLFIFFMLLLVLGDHFLILFIGWEGVGLCSYLLIGYYFEKNTAAEASKKAFLFNRVGDFGFISAVLLIFYQFGTLSFSEVNAMAMENSEQLVNSPIITAITLLLFLGATGKSAQIPLYVWLPDAMEGPTPVSALIHAATMVTSGLYMIARLSHLFVLSPTTMTVIAYTGAFTAIFAATIAITQTDIKKVLAYSTVSQLGYMFLAMGVGAFGAGVFHVLTHAFFKALLFLGSGSVIHAMHHEQDMMKMGDLKGHIPITYRTMFIGTLAIAGIPFFAGFFSKDEILWKVFSSGHIGLWLIGFITAGVTSFYMFRMIYLTFHGESRVDQHTKQQLHESGNTMLIPLVVLAFLSIFGGLLGVPHVFHIIPNGIEIYFYDFFAQSPFTFMDIHKTQTIIMEWVLMGSSVVLALIAWYFAHSLYSKDLSKVTELKEKYTTVYHLSYQKYYVDEIYNSVVIQPWKWISTTILWKVFDIKIIDKVVLLTGKITESTGGTLRVFQNGIIQSYAIIFTFGTTLLLGYFIFW